MEVFKKLKGIIKILLMWVNTNKNIACGEKVLGKRTENIFRYHHVNMMNSNMFLFPKSKQVTSLDFKDFQSLIF